MIINLHFSKSHKQTEKHKRENITPSATAMLSVIRGIWSIQFLL